MIRPIVRDVAFLAQKSEPALPEHLSVAEDLLDTLRANAERCVGLAANMIGVNRRIIAFNDEGRLRVMLNPVIVRTSRPFETEEGCLSLDGMRKTVRYLSIRVQYQDTAFQPHTETFTGFTAQIIQHECDHCEGIII